MKRLFLILFLFSSNLYAGSVAPKKVFSVSKNGTLFRGQPSTNYAVTGSTLQGTAVSTDVYVSASRAVTVASPYVETAGLVIDAVQVKRIDVISSAKSMMKSGLKTNAYGAILTILSGVAISKGWEWLEEQKAWVKNDNIFPTVQCLVPDTNVSGQVISKNFTSTALDVCLSFHTSPPPAGWVVQSTALKSSTSTLKVWEVRYKSATSSTTAIVKVQATGIGDPTINRTPISEGEVDAAVNDAINGKESQIVSDDIKNGLEFPYQSTEGFTNSPLNRPAYSPSTIVSTQTTTNPDGTSTTTTKREQTRHDYNSPTGGQSFSPSSTVTTTTTTTNNTTNTTTTTVTNQYKTPQQTEQENKEEQEKEEEPPPTAPTPELPEIEEPVLDNTKIPSIVTDTMLGFPLIPTQFNCSNPVFDAYYVKFDLPMCDWIEKFRFLFHWFWLVTTGIAIYLLATSTKIGAK